jgi:hypothetical protein
MGGMSFFERYLQKIALFSPFHRQNNGGWVE